MEIVQVERRDPLLIDQLSAVWEGSVRATHLFLSEEGIAAIKQFLPQALQGIPHLVVAKDENKMPAAFMGIEGQRLEMLFVSPAERGKGLGKRLLQYGMEAYSVNELTVNEQNPLAKGFYERMGFRVYKRTERDEQGNPYPLLYMKREL